MSVYLSEFVFPKRRNKSDEAMNDQQSYPFGQQVIQPDQEGVVTLRGFLYQTPDGVWVLSQEPNLKSCCVGSDSKVKDQIYLFGELPESPPNTVAEVTGVFRLSQKHMENGQFIHYYTLQDAKLIHKEIDYGSLIWFGAMFLGLGISVLFFRYWRRAS